MSDTVIKVENLSKKYLLHHQQQEKYSTLRDAMTNGVKNLGRKVMSPFSPKGSQPSGADEEFYALRDVSFAIKQGDRVGIIGRNGAGKSTLLKIMSRITEPTSGRIEITGRVASLLEVGTGFHPELTGRENIFLNGAILGMSKVDIKRKFDEIVAFAEVEDFLDTPVKRYSSGMYVRLAFAVAAHMEPEILIVDEVLAVGDSEFQKKCLWKMGEIANGGRTVLFVSHNMTAVENICSRVILLSNGTVVRDGDSASTVSAYLETGALSSHLEPVKLDGKYIKSIHLRPASETIENVLRCGVSWSVEITIDTKDTLFRQPGIGLGIDDLRGTRICTLGSYFATHKLPAITGVTVVVCAVSEPNLAPGIYSLKVAFSDMSAREDLESIPNALVFEVHPADYYGNGKLPTSAQGAMMLRTKWTIF